MSDEFSERELAAILARVDGWYQAFARTPEFAGLSVPHQQEAESVLELFARYNYEHLGLSPDDWDRGAVVECCTEILPRKVSAGPVFFEAMGPVLGRFFRFLQAQSMLSGAGRLAKAVEELGDEIATNAEAPGSWGPAKHLAMAALEAGVDFQDPKSLNDFMSRYNDQLIARGRPAIARSSSGSPPRTLPEAKPPFPAPASPYDPCPCGSGKKYKFCCKS